MFMFMSARPPFGVTDFSGYVYQVAEKGLDVVTSGTYGVFKESREVSDSPSASEVDKIVAGIVSIFAFCLMVYRIGEALDD